MKEILDLFTTKDELRKSMLAPSLISEDEIGATDGHALVIVKDNVLAKEYTFIEGFPDLKRVIPKENRNDIITIEQLETAFSKCRQVDETITKDLGECSKCDGRGFCDHCDMECEKCNGEGRIITIESTGKQIPYELDTFKINGITFMYPQMKRLYDVMKLLNINSITHLSGTGIKANLMRHENYTFVIMPCRS